MGVVYAIVRAEVRNHLLEVSFILSLWLPGIASGHQDWMANAFTC